MAYFNKKWLPLSVMFLSRPLHIPHLTPISTKQKFCSNILCWFGFLCAFIVFILRDAFKIKRNDNATLINLQQNLVFGSSFYLGHIRSKNLFSTVQTVSELMVCIHGHFLTIKTNEFSAVMSYLKDVTRSRRCWMVYRFTHNKSFLNLNTNINILI